ncbi:MAG: methyltransferase domain-containing protein [Alphaproteobacteria bacterium]
MSSSTALRRRVTNLIPHWVRVTGRRIAFFGTGQTCPLCRSRVRGYRSHGGVSPVAEEVRVAGAMRRENDRCPVCHGVDRTRMTMLYLDKAYGPVLGTLRILHVAPEWGLYKYLRRQGVKHYTPCDLDLFRYRHIRNIRKVNCTSLPFEDESFDLVLCSHVLEHIPDDRAAMSEFHRVLAPGGRAILQVPLALDRLETDEDSQVTSPRAREFRFCQWDHVRLYGRDYAARLERAGFELDLYDAFAEHPKDARRLHLNPVEKLYVVRRPCAMSGSRKRSSHHVTGTLSANDGAAA